MSFLRPTRKVRNFSLLSGFDYYVPGWSGMVLLAILLIAGSLLGGIVMLLLGTFMTKAEVDAYGLLITYPIQFLPAMIYASYQSRRNAAFDEAFPLDDNRFGRTGFWPLALLVIVATIAAAFMTDLATWALPPMPDYLKDLMENMTSNSPLWVSLLSVSVMAPFFEEWLCRGEIMRGLLHRVKPVWAIVLSALFFAIIHMNPWQAIPAFALGCLFGWVYYKTGSLKLTMLMHCANNTFSVLCSRLDAFKDAETWLDVLSPAQYALGFVLSAAIVAGMIYVFSRIPKE